MTGKSVEQADLITLDRQIDELRQRIGCLKERMATMTLQNYETGNQSILLATMQEVLRDMHLLRLEILDVPGSEGACPAVGHESEGLRDMLPATRRREAHPGAR